MTKGEDGYVYQNLGCSTDDGPNIEMKGCALSRSALLVSCI